MSRTFRTILQTIERVNRQNLPTIANDMTYKILLATFPFLMFLLTLMGFFTIDYHYLTDHLYNIIPDEILGVVEVFAKEVVNVRRPKILSITLIVAVISATSGFRALIDGLKRAYQEEETRGIIKLYTKSFLLLIIFTLTMIISTISIIFGNVILNIFTHYLILSPLAVFIYNTISILISLAIMLVTVITINQIALQKKVFIRDLLPGSIFTVTIWAFASFAFNLYVRNFSDMVKIYGSVAGIMVLLIWLNIICNVMLIGGAINGVKLENKNNIQ